MLFLHTFGLISLKADVTHQPDVPLASLAVIPFLALAFTHLQPIATRSLHTVSIPSTVFRVSYTLSISLAIVIPFLLSFKLPSLVDLGTAFLSYYAFSGRLHMDAPSRTPAARLVRTYMKTILRNPESRKIFYFLVLNLVYMGVQMLYGVWTNSLGLISDGKTAPIL
jgi:zinc transporter 5/7